MGGCIHLDLSSCLSPPGPQASRHVLSTQVAPLFWSRLSLLPLGTSICQLLRPCCLLSSAASPNQGSVCRAPEARGAAAPELSTRHRITRFPREQGPLPSLEGLFSRGKIPGWHRRHSAQGNECSRRRSKKRDGSERRTLESPHAFTISSSSLRDRVAPRHSYVSGGWVGRNEHVG